MDTMISLKTEHSAKEAKAFLIEAVRKHTDFSLMRLNGFDYECQQFEEQYQMKSEDFLRKFEAGELGDDIQWFDWYAAYRGRQLWQKKCEVLNGISWNE